MAIKGITKISADRLGIHDACSPKKFKDEVLSYFDDKEIIETPIEDLYGLLETRCRLYSGDFERGKDVLNQRKEEIINGSIPKRKIYDRNYYYVRKERFKRYEIKFRTDADSDVIAMLDRQYCRTDYIKELIREDIKKKR